MDTLMGGLQAPRKALHRVFLVARFSRFRVRPAATIHATISVSGCYIPTMPIDLALAVLAEQHAKAKAEKRQVPEVRLALHVLRPYAPRDWLVEYWNACGLDDPIMRQQEITRTLNGIRLRLKRDP